MPIVLVMVNVYGQSDQLGRKNCLSSISVAESLRARMSDLIGLTFCKFLAPRAGPAKDSFPASL